MLQAKVSTAYGNSIGQGARGTCVQESINNAIGAEHRVWVGTRQEVKLQKQLRN